MAKVYLELEGEQQPKLWISSNMAVFRQAPIWGETQERYQLVPANVWGCAVVTSESEGLGGIVQVAWMVFRPCVLMLEWNWRKRVQFRDMSLEQAQEWYKMDKESWVHVRPKMRNTR